MTEQKPYSSRGSRLFITTDARVEEAHRSALGKALQSVVPSLGSSRPTTGHSGCLGAARSVARGRPATREEGIGNDEGGLSEQVAKRNCWLEGPVRVAMEEPKDDKNDGEGGSPQAGVQLEELGRGLDKLGRSLAGVRDKHHRFVANTLSHADELIRNHKGIALRPSMSASSKKMQDRSSDTTTGEDESGASPEAIGSQEVNTSESHPAERFPGTRRLALHTSQKKMPSDSVQELELQKLKKQKGVRSKQQETAMAQFDLINKGQANPTEVFGAIWSHTERVQTKVDFYRVSPGSRMMLPKLEDRFMRRESQRGEHIVDAHRLVRAVECGYVVTKDGIDVQGQEDLASASNALPSPSNTARGMTQVLSTEDLWKFKGLNHDESQATLRSSQQEHFRRIDRTVDNAKRALQDRRRQQLKSIKEKDTRHANAARDRVLMTWMVLAMATDTVHCTWLAIKKELATEEKESEDDFKTGRATLRRPQKTEQPLKQTILPGIGLPDVAEDFDDFAEADDLFDAKNEWSRVSVHLPDLLKMSDLPVNGDHRAFGKVKSSRQLNLIQKKIAEKQLVEQVKAYRLQLFGEWKHLVLVHIAVVRLKKPLYMNRKAEMMKDFINQAWRGYTIRKGMKDFLRAVRFLQRAMRSFIALKKFIMNHIIAPVYWEEETKVLAELVGMSPTNLSKELQEAAAEFDVPKKLIQVQILIDKRKHIWAGQDVSQFTRKKRRRAGKLHQLGTKGLQHAATSQLGPQRLDTSCALDRDGTNHTVTSPEPSSPKTGGRPRVQHPLMDLIGSYRMKAEFKEKILTKVISDSLKRWWDQYKKYKGRKVQFQIEWQQWRLDVMALGPYHRDSWPPHPAVPQYPYELTKVDRQWLREQVLKNLKKHSSAPGGLL